MTLCAIMRRHRLKFSMKRLLLICVIFLLSVSGWGHVLAVAFCHDMQDMAGCSMRVGMTSTPSHSSHEGMEMGDMQMPPAIAESEVKAIAQPMASCCTSRPDVPPAPVIASRGAEQSKQDTGAILQQARQINAPQTISFAPPISSRQHAPPGASTPRHVLIGVFLI
jgi:hypothetical protein